MPDFVPDVGMSPGWLFALLVVVCAIEATLVLGTLVPGEVALVLAAGMVDVRLLPVVVLAAALGSYLGQCGGYGLGLVTGERIRHGALGRRLGEHRWRRGEQLMRNATVTTMIAVRFVAFGHTLAPVAAGTLGMDRRRFHVLSVVASFAWAGVWVAVGVIAGAMGRSADSTLLAVILATVGVVVAGAALTRVASRTRREESPAAASTPGSTASIRDETVRTGSTVSAPATPAGTSSRRHLEPIVGPVVSRSVVVTGEDGEWAEELAGSGIGRLAAVAVAA